jgi:hypothetical protein
MKRKSLKLESDLLGVSKPYDLVVGDVVKNINPSCSKYKSTGAVVYVNDDGNITYRINNQGATWTPGEVITRPSDHLIKIITHTAIPAYDLPTESKR